MDNGSLGGIVDCLSARNVDNMPRHARGRNEATA